MSKVMLPLTFQKSFQTQKRAIKGIITYKKYTSSECAKRSVCRVNNADKCLGCGTCQTSLLKNNL
jgi:hypothetical protein